MHSSDPIDDAGIRNEPGLITPPPDASPQSSPTLTDALARPGGPADRRSLRILLAEDSEINQRIVTAILKHEGHSVTLAQNGQDALDRLTADPSIPFDLVLMDVQMPELDGYEATVAIRERERATNARPIPVIAMTANTSIEDRDRCLVSGMNDYIPKPVTTDSLRRMLARWTHRSLSAPDSPGPATTVPTTDEGSGDPDDSENTPLDIERALDYLDGNQEILRKVLCQFMETLPQLIGQVLLAAAAGDSGGLRLSAHNLKGAAANLCADPIRRTAEQIESLASAGRLELVRPALAELEQQANRLRDFMDSKPK